MSWREFFEQERICVVIPTYNNATTVGEVLRRTLQITDNNIIVVNDGSTDNTSQILNSQEFTDVIKIEYSPNKGKGHALKSGFAEALRRGFKFAVTLDSDGQHYPEDIPQLAQALKENKNSLIAGTRRFDNENMPGQNLFANKFSNFWFHLQTGIDLSDTQCGFRIYPIDKIRGWWPITARYESELEFLVFLAWRGIRIVAVPVNVFYPPKELRVSHFKPFYDFFRISVLNTILTLAAIVCRPLSKIRKPHTNH